MKIDIVTTSLITNSLGTRQESATLSIVRFAPGELSQDQIDAINSSFPNVFQFNRDGGGRSWSQISIEEISSIIH